MEEPRIPVSVIRDFGTDGVLKGGRLWRICLHMLGGGGAAEQVPVLDGVPLDPLSFLQVAACVERDDMLKVPRPNFA